MISASSQTRSTPDFGGSTNVRAMSIATMLFFMWGFLTSLNDILIPHLKAIFDLNYAEAMLVQFAFFSSYFIFAAPAGKLVEWRGYKQSMVIGLVIMAVGALMFLPAAKVALFPVFLGAQVILAAGITCLQVAANPYVANLGPPQSAPSRLNLAQAFNSLGTTIAPFFGSAVILTAAPLAAEKLTAMSSGMQQQYRMHEASSVPTALSRAGRDASPAGIVVRAHSHAAALLHTGDPAHRPQHNAIDGQRLPAPATPLRRRGHLRLCRRGGLDRLVPH